MSKIKEEIDKIAKEAGVEAQDLLDHLAVATPGGRYVTRDGVEMEFLSDLIEDGDPRIDELEKELQEIWDGKK